MTIKMRGFTLQEPSYFPDLADFQLFSVMANCPVKAGLIGSYFLGSKNADPTHNFANPSIPLLKVGSPVISQKYASLSRGGGYFDTQLPSSATLTIVAISRYPAASALAAGVPIVSNYAKPDTIASGDTLFNRVGVQAYGNQASGVQGATYNAAITAVAGDYVITGGLIASTPAVGAFYYDSNGAVQRTIAGMTGRSVSAKTLLIGATQSSTEWLTAGDISAVLIFNTDIGAATNMQIVMDWLRKTVGVQAGIWSS